MSESPTEAEEEVEELSAAAAASPNGSSLLSGLRAKRAAISEERKLELPIPGYGGELVARYKWIEFEEINKLVKKAEKRSQDPLVDVKLAADVLVRMCEEVLIEVDGKLVPLGEAVREFDGETIDYTDPRLAEAVGVAGDLPERPTARESLIAIFGNKFALVQHSNEVTEWARESEPEGF